MGQVIFCQGMPFSADALATAVFVVGLREGMDLVERLPHVEALIIDATIIMVEKIQTAATSADSNPSFCHCSSSVRMVLRVEAGRRLLRRCSSR